MRRSNSVDATMYDLNCIYCDFESTESSIEETFDTVEDHRDRHGDHHFVEFERK